MKGNILRAAGQLKGDEGLTLWRTFGPGHGPGVGLLRPGQPFVYPGPPARGQPRLGGYEIRMPSVLLRDIDARCSDVIPRKRFSEVAACPAESTAAVEVEPPGRFRLRVSHE